MSTSGPTTVVIDQVIKVTACDEDTAKYYLCISNNVPQSAINSYFASGGKAPPKDWDNTCSEQDNDFEVQSVESKIKAVMCACRCDNVTAMYYLLKASQINRAIDSYFEAGCAPVPGD